MNTDRLDGTSANELAAQVQKNASELGRSVGDLAGKFIQEQPYTASCSITLLATSHSNAASDKWSA